MTAHTDPPRVNTQLRIDPHTAMVINALAQRLHVPRAEITRRAIAMGLPGLIAAVDLGETALQNQRTAANAGGSDM